MNEMRPKPMLGFLKTDSWASFTIVLIMVTLVCMMVFSLAGMMLASVIWHIPVIEFGLIDPQHVSADKVSALKLIQLVSAAGTFILPPFWVLYIFRKDAPEFLKINLKPTLVVLLQATLVFVILFPALEWMISINEGMKLPESLSGVEQWMQDREIQLTTLVNKFLEVNTIGGLLVNLLVIAIIPAVGEEFFFRGILQNVFSKWFKNIHWAIVITSVIFSAIHLQFYGFLPRLILGLILGYLYVWSGNLWTSVYFHFLNNGVAVIYAYLANVNIIQSQWDEPMNSTNITVIISFLITAVVLIGLAMYYDHKRKKNDDWVKVFESENLQEVEIYHGVLENEEIPAIIMNKRDSIIKTFGIVELFVRKEHSEKALEILSKDINIKQNRGSEEETYKDE